ncbi:hypothetical protein NHQ30_003060 [Ciborinia camelliae]|nr:hypothetical protein NHQ30_003060 [Ciborinia camelliae]
MSGSKIPFRDNSSLIVHSILGAACKMQGLTSLDVEFQPRLASPFVVLIGDSPGHIDRCLRHISRNAADKTISQSKTAGVALSHQACSYTKKAARQIVQPHSSYTQQFATGLIAGISEEMRAEHENVG